MNKQQLIDYLNDRLPENAVFEVPFHTVEKPAEPSGIEYSGHNNDGFAIMKPLITGILGAIEISYAG